MAFYRLYPSKDTSIANGDPSVWAQDISDANVGASEILNIYYTVESVTSSAHTLVQFDLDKIPLEAKNSGPTFQLKLFDAQHSGTIPTEFDAVVYQVSQSWQEGAGHDMDYYTDNGASNWFSASNSASWSVAGGSSRSTAGLVLDAPLPVPFFNSVTSSYHFYTGHEDLDTDVTPAVNDWMTNGNNFGFFIKVDPTLTSRDYYIKKFHSRHTHFPTKRPYLDVRWNDWTGSFSLHNIYTATTGPYSGSVFSTSTFTAATLAALITTGSLAVSAVPSVTVDPTGALVSQISDLRSVYSNDEVVTLHLHTQLKDWNPATVATASAATPNVLLTSMYYRITDVVTGEVVVPFGIAPVAYTKLSYNDNGNYFKLHMNSLPEGQLLQIDFIYQTPVGDWIVLPGTANRFRVTTNG
jgi:hypothetical protein